MKQPADIFMDVLTDARKARGVSREELSSKTGIPEHTIKRWEEGGQRPRLSSAIKLASILGYRIELREVVSGKN